MGNGVIECDECRTLLDLGLDPSLKNKSGQVPYSCATSKECRDYFRKFMGQYPEKYDYKKVSHLVEILNVPKPSIS